MNYENLAHELIETRCGTHSLGLIYDFLLEVCKDATQAKAEFIKFMSGELPECLFEEARLWVAEEQEADPAPPRADI